MYCVGISKIKKKESYLCESCKEKNSSTQETKNETNLNGENLKEKQLPASDMIV
jgi:protein-arginine kinase activator protein McsA